MKCLVTGATGFVGDRLVEELLKKGNQVHVLARSPDSLSPFLAWLVTPFQGDLNDRQILNRAMKGCDTVFHLAAYANIWSKDKRQAWNTNVAGTKNILEAALQNNIKKIVFTSTAAILPPSPSGEAIDENAPWPEKFLTDYETTKMMAEQLCQEYSQKGLNIVIVNPPRIFGPGLLSKSNSLTLLIKKYIEGKWRIIPGNGKAIGSYVFIDDVINGHLLAMQKGVSGERYILGGTNISFNDFFKLLAYVSGKKTRLFHLPCFLMLLISKIELLMAECFSKKPLITPAWVKRYLQNRPVSSQKAITQLDYTITPLDEGIRKTINWLKTKEKWNSGTML